VIEVVARLRNELSQGFSFHESEMIDLSIPMTFRLSSCFANP
jgi:hypothetical protein